MPASSREQRGRILEAAVCFLFVALLGVQWRGLGFLPGTDAIAYIVGGINLVATGTFTNASGQPELWFPPLYPILIGTLSLGGRLDYAVIVPVLSATMAVAGMLLVGSIARHLGGRAYEPAVAMALVALNPIYSSVVIYGLSEPTATALALSAFVLWLSLSDQSPHWKYAGLGLVVGLGYLTRPESLLLLPCWALADVLRSRMSGPLIGRYMVAAGMTLIVALPYVFYLYDHTGQVTLTGKTAINLTSGRATFSGQPTHYIDPVTLEVGLFPYDVSVGEDVRRVAWNSARVIGTYVRNLVALLALPIVLGLVAFVRAGQLRFLYGGVAFVAYLAVVVLFQMKARFLHLSLPFLSILAARGMVLLLGSRSLTPNQRWRVRAGHVLALAIGVALILQSAVMVRADVGNRRGFSLLRDAGERVGRLDPQQGVVFDQWGQIAFHARRTSWILTPNDIHTILRYIDKHAPPGQPVYLALSSLEAQWYHPTVRALIQSPAGFPLQREFELSDRRGTVVVYRVLE